MRTKAGAGTTRRSRAGHIQMGWSRNLTRGGLGPEPDPRLSHHASLRTWMIWSLAGRVTPSPGRTEQELTTTTRGGPKPGPEPGPRNVIRPGSRMGRVRVRRHRMEREPYRSGGQEPDRTLGRTRPPERKDPRYSSVTRHGVGGMPKLGLP